MMLFFLLLYFVFSSYKNNLIQVAAGNIDVDPTQTIVWGPGLNPDDVTLGARYIFLQLVNIDGNNVTESPGKNILSAHISGETETGTPCPIWSQSFDCKDGTFIVRYRIYNTCYKLRIKLRVKNKLLSLKKSNIPGPVYEEECYCPEPSIQSWLTKNECSQNYSQILHDLEPFPSLNFNDLRSKIIKRYNKPNSVSICHYIIKSNKIYRQCYGQHVGFKTFVDSVFLSLSRKVILPDIEFFMNLGDWPLVPKDKELVPIFSWCGSEDSKDIILPTYDITQSSIGAMGNVMLDMISVQGNAKPPWSSKIEKLFWRGRDSRRERLDLIDIARENPNLFNVSITNFFFFKDEIEKYGPGQKHISFFDFFEYKYQLCIDGTVAAFRFPYLLAGDSLVFKPNSKYYEFFYKDLQADRHFIPVESDLSNLVEKIKWAIEHDNEAYKISREAQQYVRDNLMPHNIFCYYISLIQEWSKRLENTVQILPEMEPVHQPEHKCKCVGKKDSSIALSHGHGKQEKDEL